MLLTDIKPYARFVRHFELNFESRSNPQIPYDSRLFYTLQGQGQIEADGALYEMLPGTVLLVNPGVEYHLKTPEISVTYFAVNFDYTFCHSDLTIPIRPAISSEFKKEQQLENIKLEDFSALQTHLYIPNMRKIEQRCWALEYEYAHKFNHFELLCSSILGEILMTAIRSFEAAEPQYSEKLGEILDFVHQNFKKSLTNLSLAERFGYHPNYLSEIIKRHTGIPLHRYLLQLRIMHAISLLESGQKNIGSVAESCGFRNIYHFSKVFKDTVGVSPKNYQR